MQYLQQLWALATRNVILRYKHSIIGFLWGFLKPLLYLLIFIVIFSSQFNSASEQVRYITSGILFWFFFSNVTLQGAHSIVQAAGLIKSLALPVSIFPLAEVLAEGFNLLLAFLVYLILMIPFGMTYSSCLFYVMPVAVLFALFTFAITLLLASLHVYYRDVGILWNTLQPALFYLTPIAYTEQLIPQRFAWIIRYNPVYAFIRLFRAPLLQNHAPDFRLFGWCTLLTSGCLLMAFFIFNKLKNQFITAI